ncbi:hypothetical protein V495_05029 [Pseudogymnoascus sp. VKM F-4514 (FW-929)]|nr:hypothetical protein V495_05029 [Pseudogymnoascus sp. VKM F-4514 (FW-929)]KFY63327.1 hypothetical protein V497_02048 [Pseudogymnoascus sp. VKM F-4516 (FW-969)]
MLTPSTKSPLTRGLPTGPRATACIACQKQKVRCIMDDGEPPCQRCARRRFNCILRKYNTSREDNNADLGSALVHDIKIIHAALDEMRSGEEKPPMPPLLSTSVLLSISNNKTSNGSPKRDDAGDVEIAVELDSLPPPLETDIDPAPAKSLYRITRLKSLRSHEISAPSTQTKGSKFQPKDLISAGALGLADANRLVETYLRRSNHYLYDITSKYDTLASIRMASPILLTAICAVGALQDSSADSLYCICRNELHRLVLDFIFKPSIELEDLRGLIIASFWISDISWTVSGLAIRRALEVDLPSSFGSLASAGQPNNDPNLRTSHAQYNETALERMKLWYLLYICDQQLSIFYGRSPMLGNQESIRNFASYLNATPDPVYNQRIMSQVSLLSILREASNLFGFDTYKRIPTVFKSQLDNIIHQVDAWAGKWLSCYSNHSVIGEYPGKAVSLHYHFAKLVVCSGVFRGIPQDNTENRMPFEFCGIAQLAVQSAISIINSVIADVDLTAAIVGWPHYFHSIIAYACSFLIKTVTVHRGSVNVAADTIKDLLAKIIELCRGLRTLAVNHFGADQDNDQAMEQSEACQAEPEALLFPGGSNSTNPSLGGQLDLLDDSGLPTDSASGTFMMPSELVHGFGGIYYNLFNDSIPYPTEGVDNSFLLPTGPHKSGLSGQSHSWDL